MTMKPKRPCSACGGRGYFVSAFCNVPCHVCARPPEIAAQPSAGERLFQAIVGAVDAAWTSGDCATVRRLIDASLTAARIAGQGGGRQEHEEKTLARRDTTLAWASAADDRDVYSSQLAALTAAYARVREALEQIADPPTRDCFCEHDTADCCALVEDAGFCAICIAAKALQVSVSATTPYSPDDENGRPALARDEGSAVQGATTHRE